MPSRLNTSDIHLDHIHSEAVWQGIGEMLRDSLTRDQSQMPQNLRQLLARLPELDGEAAPPIAPAMDCAEPH